MVIALQKWSERISPEQWFMVSAFLVNGGNYVYNLLLGRILGPAQFADAAILITLLLVLSFVAMTFQLTVAKFALHFEGDFHHQFIKRVYTLSLGIGIGLGCVVIACASKLQHIFHTQSYGMFIIFGIATPLYFLMSVNRGRWQGNSSFTPLSMTYQFEMITRLAITLLCILIFRETPTIGVAVGMACSFIAGMLPFKKYSFKKIATIKLPAKDQKLLLHFFLYTAFYELTQIICNNSDILLVKHFFPDHESGLYASLALIGRVVYFVTWMFVMLLLPKVIAKKKNNEDTNAVLMKYCSYVIVFAAAVILGSFLFPEMAVRMLFGDAYIAIAPLLGWYALATSLFALSNIFVYYFLSLETYLPVYIGALGGILQIVLIYFFHENLYQVVYMQIIAMGLLCVAQISYYYKKL